MKIPSRTPLSASPSPIERIEPLAAIRRAFNDEPVRATARRPADRRAPRVRAAST